jgi:hypothetical protein
MKLILLLPIVAYLCLMLVNLELLRDFQVLNIFGAQSIEMPLILFSSIFIVVYAVVVYVTYSWINSWQAHKIKKYENKIDELKALLYDNQGRLLESLEKNYTSQFTAFKKDNDIKFETLIRYNEYTLEKVIEENSGSFTKYRKETQKLLADTKWVDGSILEKLKIWK